MSVPVGTVRLGDNADDNVDNSDDDENRRAAALVAAQASATQAVDIFTQTSIHLEVDTDDENDYDNNIPASLLPTVNKTENIAGNMQMT